MNKSRRAATAKIIKALEDINNQIEALMDEEQEYFDNMPESFQFSEKGNAAEQAIDNYQNAMDEFDSITMCLEEATE